MLSSISDKELLSRVEHLRRTERETTVEILKHLNEIERRGLYLRLGYSSMFAYCTGHLRYSESAAGRRVQVARCLVQFPEIALFLERGEVSVVTVSLVAGILTKSSANELLEKIRGKTQSEVEAIASGFRPPTKLRDRVRHVTVPAPAAPMRTTAADLEIHSHSGSEKTPNSARVVARVFIQFLADEAFMAKYKEACALLSNKMRKPSFETVFGELLDEFIERHSPNARQERRKDRASDHPMAGHRKASLRREGRPSIPARARDAVFVRDRKRCTYVGENGRQCGETRHLHVDHVKPVARGGTNDVSNLRILCARHNQLEADRILGKAMMDRSRGKDNPTPPP